MIIVIVMPTYNEASCISTMIETLMEHIFSQIREAEMHLLIIDDSSPDGTSKIVRDKIRLYPRLHLLKGIKKGLGWAYVHGLTYAIDELHADAVIEMDADFQHDPSYVPEMVRIYRGGADYVIGSRYIEGGSIPVSWPWHRKFLSYLGNWIIRYSLRIPHIHDFTTGFRLSRVKGVLDQISLKDMIALDRFAFKIDLLNQTMHFARCIVELPIQFRERASGVTKFSLKELIATCKVLISFRLKKFRHYEKR